MLFNLKWNKTYEFCVNYNVFVENYEFQGLYFSNLLII